MTTATLSLPRKVVAWSDILRPGQSQGVQVVKQDVADMGIGE